MGKTKRAIRMKRKGRRSHRLRAGLSSLPRSPPSRALRTKASELGVHKSPGAV